MALIAEQLRPALHSVVDELFDDETFMRTLSSEYARHESITLKAHELYSYRRPTSGAAVG